MLLMAVLVKSTRQHGEPTCRPTWLWYWSIRPLLVRGLVMNFGLDLRGSAEASTPRKGSDPSCSISIIDLI